MTSASAVGGGGGTPKADESSDKLRECDIDKGGQKIRKFCGHHLSTAPYRSGWMVLVITNRDDKLECMFMHTLLVSFLALASNSTIVYVSHSHPTILSFCFSAFPHRRR